MDLVIVNELIPDADFQEILHGEAFHLNLVQKYWPKMFDNLKGETRLNNPTIRVSNDQEVMIYLTERKLHPNKKVMGYHTEEFGLPVAYCSLRRSGRKFGIYHPAVIHTNRFTHQSKVLFGERFVPGVALTIAHEVAEIVADPHVKTLSAIDGHDRRWLVEIADHCAGSYLLYTDSVTKIDVVLPDVTTPAFYSLTGQAPFTIKNAVSSPFTLTPHGYGFYVDPAGVEKAL